MEQMVLRIVTVVVLCFCVRIGQAGEGLPQPVRELAETYCVDCHGHSQPEADFDIEALLESDLSEQIHAWEKIVRRVRTRQMPPADAYRPAEKDYARVTLSLEDALDDYATRHPDPGRTETFRRLTRFEYQNSIRDLLDLQIDVSSWLPADEVSHGFDHITVGELSPTLLNRYITAAQRISRLALGRASAGPDLTTIRVKPDITQEKHVEGLPLGTRGGVLIPFNFPEAGEYEIRARLTRDRNEEVEGLKEPHEVEFLIDRERVGLFTVKPPKGKAWQADSWAGPTHENVDRHLVARVSVEAGPHEVAATFLRKSQSLLETKRQPLNVSYNMYRHPRIGPAIFQVSIAGPFRSADTETSATLGKHLSRMRDDIPSRQQIFVCYPETREEEDQCAEQILSRLMRLAFRRSVDPEDLKRTMRLFAEARDQSWAEVEQASQSRRESNSAKQGDESDLRNTAFEDGIEMALSSILVHPKFLFRVETAPEDVESGMPYQIDDFALASRLSYFLWSSLPDEQLLNLAEQQKLRDPLVLRQQVDRMLADERSLALVRNFAGQWLYLRNLESITPDMRLYPDFDDNLRQAFRRETELLFEAVMREDRSVFDLLDSDFTFLNERLAKHYGIPNVYGSRFRRVQLDPDWRRGGLLRHGSILTVTSYATRTSPVIRGKWILENILGTPPPPPPPDVPALSETPISAKLPVRERLAKHREDAACAVCHDLIDPVGFTLENFDAVGRWREMELGVPVDSSGGLPDGRTVDGVDGLEAGLAKQPELFVATMTEKLLTYATGRGLEYYDAPAIRKIVRNSSEQDYRFSALIYGVVNSTPFRMRTAQ
jgi:hypothetical protein